ncbi:DUF6415 family natural product biosynthesis protein [Streptomyces sp. CC208A]|uniref:DUF6415 family natural product biosynthesis protein n=1 Tax=Streptomyces sp. CC208A TaxID=3044573 RepID=UPI0024A8F6D2|nr:DUF6415 family natural product biosynthesis protein [Streptomyces sp. CC208A]
MDETPQHDRPTEPAGHAVEMDLGALLLEVADVLEHHVETAAARDITYATGMRHDPGEEALAALTDRLLGHCAMLAIGVGQIPDKEQTTRARAAVKAWEKLVDDGPDGGALGNWSYCKYLARTGRDMLGAIREHRVAQRAGFIGHPGLPPAPVDAP